MEGLELVYAKLCIMVKCSTKGSYYYHRCTWRRRDRRPRRFMALSSIGEIWD